MDTENEVAVARLAGEVPAEVVMAMEEAMAGEEVVKGEEKKDMVAVKAAAVEDDSVRPTAD